MVFVYSFKEHWNSFMPIIKINIDGYQIAFISLLSSETTPLLIQMLILGKDPLYLI